MSRIEIFEAAGCCATSGVTVQDSALQWNADLQWARQSGISIQRYSLAKNPQSFITNPLAQAFLNSAGPGALPLILLDGAQVMAGQLPSRADLARWADVPFSQDWDDDRAIPACCNIPRLP